MLIKCPECGKEISDKAEVCIGCGDPINKQSVVGEKTEESNANPNIRSINGKDIDITEIIYFIRNKEKIKAIKLLREISGLGLKEAKDIVDSMELDSTLQVSSSTKSNISSGVRCPKCGSTQIQMVNRRWSLMTGFLTNKVDRVCMNCKHKF